MSASLFATVKAMPNGFELSRSLSTCCSMLLSGATDFQPQTTNDRKRTTLKNKTNATKPTADREAVRVLAIELGAREAARRLKLNPNTVLSWARRYDWKLPDRRNIGRPAINPSALSLQSGDVLLDEHKRLEGQTKTALMQTLHKAAQAVARKAPLDISNMGQFRDACLSAARMFGWDGNAQPSVTYYGDDNRQVIVCPPERRQQLIEQRQRLLEQEATQASGREVKAAIPAPETHSNANVGAVDGIVAQDPIMQHMQSIGRAESWKSEENHAGMFAPYPEEFE
jgi:hypothetical protein